MCMNCGCKMNDDDMGNPKNITMKDIREAAEAGNGGDVKAALQNIKEAAEEELKRSGE